MEKILRVIKKIIPRAVFQKLQPAYHWLLSFLGAALYRFPSREIFVIGVTGTKGKSTTIELINAILERAGHKTALAGTVRFKIGKYSARNMYKMTMPGRFFTQQFLRDAVKAKCQYVILEMTSEGVKQFRHKFISLDALVFTNLSPEHIESHGSYEKYVAAKLEIARALHVSKKPKRIMIANTDDKEAVRFLAFPVDEQYPYSLKDVEPYREKDGGYLLNLSGGIVHSPIPGIFNIYNVLAAVRLAESQKISNAVIKEAIESFQGVPGRVQKIDAGQNFDVVVDYAHTPDSLEKLYQTFSSKRLICVLGNTGGGRDAWKRKEMGAIADTYCDQIILTNEDPYDEDPRAIVEDMKRGIREKPVSVIMDRRQAIHSAIMAGNETRKDKRAIEKPDVAVLITGKGTDPYIMGPNGSKEEWDDASVVLEELRKTLNPKS